MYYIQRIYDTDTIADVTAGIFSSGVVALYLDYSLYITINSKQRKNTNNKIITYN